MSAVFSSSIKEEESSSSTESIWPSSSSISYVAPSEAIPGTLSCALIFQDWIVPAQVKREFKYYNRCLQRFYR